MKTYNHNSILLFTCEQERKPDPYSLVLITLIIEKTLGHTFSHKKGGPRSLFEHMQYNL